MSAPTGILATLRAEWAKRYTDTITVTTTTDLGEPNADGVHDSPTAPQIYDGPALVRPEMGEAADGLDRDFGQQVVAVQPYRITTPYDAALFPIGPVVTVTASTDSLLIGQTFTIRRQDFDAYQTHRRYSAHLDQGPGEVHT